MSIAVRTLRGSVFVESIDCQPIRNGNAWILKFLKKAAIETLVIDGAGNQEILAGDVKENKIKVEMILPTVKEVIVANSKWEKAIFQKEVFHNNQPSLTAVVTNCQKRPIGTQGGFGYKSLYTDRDIGLMDSAILAHWAATLEKKS